MFRAIAALALASASAHTAPPLNASAPWWERVTVTVSDDGQTQSCRYQTSFTPDRAQNCSVVGADASMANASSSSGAKDEVTRITFERRFSPTASPSLSSLKPGETLLGGRMMALAINGAGAVENCRIVSTSGSVTPQYGCEQAAAEHFTASATGSRDRGAEHQGYMTVLVYGHSEHVV